jgi:hypothetical protein
VREVARPDVRAGREAASSPAPTRTALGRPTHASHQHVGRGPRAPAGELLPVASATKQQYVTEGRGGVHACKEKKQN